jgi:hypothetical protein
MNFDKRIIELNDSITITQLTTAIDEIYNQENAEYDYFLDVNKPNCSVLEKVIYDIVMFQFNEMRLKYDENKYFIEFWIKRKVATQLKFHVDCDEYGFTTKKVNNVNLNIKNDTYARPFLTCILYLNDNSTDPTIITNIDNEMYLKKNFNNVNIGFSFPEKLKLISFNGGKYFHTGISINDELNERYAIFINFWDDEYILKNKIPYIKYNFSDELQYSINSVKHKNSILKIKNQNSIKIVYYNEKDYNNNYFETLLNNSINNKKKFDKLIELIKNSGFNNYDSYKYTTYIIKPMNRCNIVII